MAKKEEKKRVSVWQVLSAIGMVFRGLVSVLFFFLILLFFIGLFTKPVDIYTGNVAVIPIKGTIVTEGAQELLKPAGVSSDKIVDWIKTADKEKKFKAILLDINSPGGSPVAADDIGRAVKEANKTVVAVIRERGTSGAYWIASAADRVFANRMSLTGSIGVTSSRLEFAGLLEDYNVTYRRLVAGKYKDAGSRWKQMSPEEQELFQKMLDKVHAEFVQEVARNRGLSVEQVKKIAHGFALLGSEALEKGLVDELGSKQDAIKWIEQKFGIKADLYEFKERKTLIDLFAEAVSKQSYNLGQGIASVLLVSPEKVDLIS